MSYEVGCVQKGKGVFTFYETIMQSDGHKNA